MLVMTTAARLEPIDKQENTPMSIRNETARAEQIARHQARVDRARGVYGTGAIDKLDNEKALT